MSIADDLVKAFNEGYEQGKAETEAYLLHCGDVTPVTNADRIRTMTDEELAEQVCDHTCMLCPIEGCEGRIEEGRKKCKQHWLDWLKQEVDDEHTY